MENNISLAISIQEITDCFAVMKELRSQLELTDFIDRVQKQQQHFGYRLIYLQVKAKAQKTGEPFLIDWMPALTADVQFYWIKFYGFTGHEWEPLYPVTLTCESNIEEILMVVDSGAQLSLISREVGNSLGFEVSRGEPITVGQGVGGEVQYVKRIIDLTIDERTFKAPVAWLLTEVANAPLLLGREVVFDLFDIKFVQADERIEFEWRGEGG